MAEQRPFQFDSRQRSVGAAAGKRRIAWPWIALSLAVHGAIILFALMGAARGGHTELLGTITVTVVGAPSAGDPDSRSAEGEPESKPEPVALPRPAAPPQSPTASAAIPQPVAAPEAAPRAPSTEAAMPPKQPERAEAPDALALPRPARQAEAAPQEPRPASDLAPKRPETAAPAPPPPPRQAAPAEKAPAEPRLAAAPPPTVPAKPATPPLPPRAKAPGAAAAPARPARAGVKQAPKGQTASLGTPTGGDRLGRGDNDDTTGMLNVNLNPRFRAPPAPPVYPRQSIARDEEGVVLVRALVDPSGAPQRVLVHKGSGFPLLDDAALEAVRRWRFEPMVRDGRATSAWVQVPVRFRLN